MNTRSFLFAVGIVFAAALTLSCSDEKDDASGGDSSSGGNVSSSSSIASDSSSSSLGDAVSSSSIVASSSSSSSNAPSSSSIAVTSNMCGTTQYNSNDPNYKCVDNVLEAKCGTTVWFWYDVSKFRCENNVLEGKCGENWYGALSQRCGTGNVVEDKCGEDWFDPTDETLRCNANGLESKCGEKWYNWHKAFECHDGIAEEICGGEFYNPAMEYCSNGTTVRAYGSVADKDGNIYKTVVIGSQTWLAENLYYMPKNGSGTCAQNLLENCKKYGISYTASTVISEDICPVGWHVPNNDGWEELIHYVGGPTIAGKHLKSKEGWGRPGEDTYGFKAISTNGAGASASWHSSTRSSTILYYAQLTNTTDAIALNFSGGTIPVRCIKD